MTSKIFLSIYYLRTAQILSENKSESQFRFLFYFLKYPLRTVFIQFGDVFIKILQRLYVDIQKRLNLVKFSCHLGHVKNCHHCGRRSFGHLKGDSLSRPVSSISCSISLTTEASWAIEASRTAASTTTFEGSINLLIDGFNRILNIV